MGGCQSINDNTTEMDCSCYCSRASRSRRTERKKKIQEAVAADAKIHELLSHIHGRMCVNGSSSVASIFSQQGRKGINQDAMIVWENFASLTETTFCGVFDGHGPYGHLVARKVRDSLPTVLVSHWQRREREEEEEDDDDDDDEEESEIEDMKVENPGMFKAWKQCLRTAFNIIDEELRAHPAIDCFCSGTTAVTMLLQGNDMVLANVGDSRAILGTMVDDKTIEAVQLTVDLKPNLPNEAERIKKCRGRVFALEDEPEVARIWLPYEDSPGLAMARAFGDFCLKDFGLIAVPDVTYRRITDKDQFIVLATDGVWDVLSNKEVVDVVSSAPTRTSAARALVETAVRSWRLKYPTSKVDDCAVVCLFLNDQARSSIDYPSEKLHNNDSANDNEEVAKAIASPTGEGDRQIQHKDEKDDTCESVAEGNAEILQNRHSERKSLAECLETGDEEWSALEGVTRVNSLLNLPRFLSSDKNRKDKGDDGGKRKEQID